MADARSYGGEALDTRARRPGERLHRIAQREGERGVDREEAHRRIAAQPWAASARYLGVSRGYHVFAFPDPTDPGATTT